MHQSILFGLIGLILGTGIGLISPRLFHSNDLMLDHSMEMPASESATTAHGHATLEIEPTKPIPGIMIEAFRDTKDGYNIHLMTTNFTFTAAQVNTAPVANQGHAHIFVNSEKVARVYGEWFHLPAKHLQDGANSIEVTLNANDHSEWTYMGEHLSATVVVEK